MKPCVSVIVPVYNVEKYLRKCLDSLVAQTLENIEIIAVNDASPDGSLAILREYEKKYPGKIVVIDSPDNRRTGGARNLALPIAKSEYIGFVDSDDWVAPDMFRLLYERAAATDSDITQILHYRCPKEDEHIPDFGWLYHEKKELDNKVMSDHDREILLLSGGGGIWSKLYKRSLILDNKLFFPEHLGYDDNFWDPLCKMYAMKYSLVEKHTYFYRDNPVSVVTTRNAMHHFDRLTIERMKLEECKKRGLFDRYYDVLEIVFVKLFYYNTILTIFTRFDKPDMKRIQEIRDELYRTFPKFRHNPYWNTIFKPKDRFIMRLLDISPALVYSLRKLKRRFQTA